MKYYLGPHAQPYSWSKEKAENLFKKLCNHCADDRDYKFYQSLETSLHDSCNETMTVSVSNIIYKKLRIPLLRKFDLRSSHYRQWFE